jgi:hypothetical protein
MRRLLSCIVSGSFALPLVVLAAQTLSAKTVVVGDCQPQLVSYSTISAAVAAVPPNSTVLVCPGTYPEQVTISQPMTLKGLKTGIGSKPVITVPSGGLVGNNPAQLSAQQPDPIEEFEEFGPVNISNLIVDGTGSGFDCSTGELTGIEYVLASGTLENVEVRNQNPGGCGYGIQLFGSDLDVLTVNVRNSRVHNFDNTGINVEDGGGSNFEVTLSSNWVASTSGSVQAGVAYVLSQGLITRNLIVVGGQYGLSLFNFFCCMTVTENTVTGSNIGINLGANDLSETSTVTNNILYKNGKGIFTLGGTHIIESNAIAQSSIAAIDLNCSSRNTAEDNVIFGAPVGIANATSGDTVAPNTFFGVLTSTTACP